jgi:hypothetical protein
MELHAKREREQKAELAAHKEDIPDQDEDDANLICAIPMAGVGAALILGSRFNRGFYRISGFKYLAEVAPIVSQKFPENWARWRARCVSPSLREELEFIDQCAAGPLLEGDALIQAVRAKAPAKGAQRREASSEAQNVAQ